MKTFFHKPFRWTAIFSIILSFSVTFVMLDTFVIERVGTPIATASGTADTNKSFSSDYSVGSASASEEEILSTTPIITTNSYKDSNIQITIDTVREYDTTIYVADIQISNMAYLKTAFAKNTYGRNIKQTTSTMAQNNNAILAINGDYYGFSDYGFVLRNGVLYRDTVTTGENDEDLAIDSAGNFSIINESNTDAQTLIDSKVWQVLSFGPALINGGDIVVTSNSEVSKAMTSNPRTAIGQVSALHYIVIVSDGRTNESEGLSLLELAQVFADRECTVAYNLDGGGSSTLWFNGQLVNNPTNGNSDGERSVSDIVYFGY